MGRINHIEQQKLFMLCNLLCALTTDASLYCKQTVQLSAYLNNVPNSVSNICSVSRIKWRAFRLASSPNGGLLVNVVDVALVSA